MKRIAALVSFVSTFTVAAPAYAQSLCPPGAGFDSLCNLQKAGVGGLVGTGVEVLLIIGIIMCLFYLVWGGVRYISSGGDKAKVDSARSTLIAAVVGLVIAVLAFFVTNFLLNFFTGQGLSGLSLPTLLQ